MWERSGAGEGIFFFSAGCFRALLHVVPVNEDGLKRQGTPHVFLLESTSDIYLVVTVHV